MSTYNARLTKTSATVYKLNKKIGKGILDELEDPKSVLLSDPVFQNQKLANFRTCYHNASAKYLIASHGEFIFLPFYISSLQ